MNLKVPGAILPLGCAILSTRAITVRGVGTTPLRRTRVKQRRATYVKSTSFVHNYRYFPQICKANLGSSNISENYGV